jgi:DNA-binding transcriptional ArsR family regulator
MNGPRATRNLLPPEAVAAVASRFRLLGSPSRLRILDALMDGPLGAGELVQVTGLTQSNLSRHVAALEAGGCVSRIRAGQTVRVAIADESLKDLCALVCGALREAAAAAHAALAEQ